MLNELVRIADATFERTRLEALDIHQTETSIATPIEWLTQPRYAFSFIMYQRLLAFFFFAPVLGVFFMRLVSKGVGR